MTTAIIGTGGIGSAIARQLAAGGEALQLERRQRVGAQAGRDNRRSGGRRARQPERFAGSRCCRPCAAVFGVERRHRRDRRRAGRDVSRRAEQSGRTRRTRQGRATPTGRAVIGSSCCWVVADRDTLCHCVRHHVGRPLRVLEPPVARARGSVLRVRERAWERRSRPLDPNGGPRWPISFW